MPLTIRRVLLIDGTGAKLERATVVVDGDRIVAVGPDSRVKIPRGSRVIEGQGRALLPGLIDCHVHYCLDAGPDVIRTLEQDDPTVTAIKAVTHARATLEAGITTVRDVGSRDHISIFGRPRDQGRDHPGPPYAQRGPSDLHAGRARLVHRAPGRRAGRGRTGGARADSRGRGRHQVYRDGRRAAAGDLPWRGAIHAGRAAGRRGGSPPRRPPP